MTIAIIGYLTLINIVGFAIFGIDKWFAKKGWWRISEKDLLIITALGGFIGTITGMEYFRHKTIKGKFLWKFWAIVIPWIALFGRLLIH